MANIIPLKDNTGAQFYPQTHEKAVVDSNGVNLQTKLASITTPTYVTAWDGDSTPVVANIPAGVTVTYNTTSYTGTLAASASTANKTYLVSTGTTDNYNRYVTQLNGSTYSWQNLGSTEIDLSDYATKEELSQLDQKVNVGDNSQTVCVLDDFFFINGLGINSSTGAPQENAKVIASRAKYDIAPYNIGGKLRFIYKGASTNKIWVAIGFFTSSNTFISRVGFAYVTEVDIPQNAAFFSIGLGLASAGGTDIGGKQADYDLANYYIAKQENIVLADMAVPGPVLYFGKKFRLDHYMAVNFLRNAYQTENQSSAYYGGYLFCFRNENTTVRVFDLKGKDTSLQTINMPSGQTGSAFHCNNANFSNIKYDPSDDFPLLYVSAAETGDVCAFVYRVGGTRGAFSLTLVQTIALPTPSAETVYYPNIALDNERGKIILYGLTNTPWSSGWDNIIKYAEFELPDISNETATLNWNDAVNVFTVPNVPTGQGAIVHNGRVIQALGMSTNGEVHIINLATHEDETVLPLYGAIAKEPESVFIFDGKLCVHVRSANCEIYQLET